jgi:hypothetical protein
MSNAIVTVDPVIAKRDKLAVIVHEWHDANNKMKRDICLHEQGNVVVGPKDMWESRTVSFHSSRKAIQLPSRSRESIPGLIHLMVQGFQ